MKKDKDNMIWEKKKIVFKLFNSKKRFGSNLKEETNKFRKKKDETLFP